MMPPNHIFRKCTGGYKLTKSQEKIYHLTYIDDIKLCCQQWKRIGNPNTGGDDIQSRHRDGIRHRKMSHANNEMREMTLDLRNRTTIPRKDQNARRKGNLKYLGILEADAIKQMEKKENLFKKYLRRTRKLLETKLYCRNLIKGGNTWDVPLVRYSGLFLKWAREELQQMDQRTRNSSRCIKPHNPETTQSECMGQGTKEEEDLLFYTIRIHMQTTQYKYRRTVCCSGTNIFINIWVQFLDMRRKTQFIKVFYNHTILTTAPTFGTSRGVSDFNSSSLVGTRKT